MSPNLFKAIHMGSTRTLRAAGVLGLLAATLMPSAVAQMSANLIVPPIPPVTLPSVLTYHYDNARTGLDSEDFGVWPGNINWFRRLFAHQFKGDVYGQPLYVPNLFIPGKGTHNVVFVVTEEDDVYAFDADDNAGQNANPLWKASLIDAKHFAAPGAAPVTVSDVTFHVTNNNCDNITPDIGITSTPVIDDATNTMYVEAKSKENGKMVHRLHALDVSTGDEKPQGPVNIGDGTAFDNAHQLNRPGLLLSKGRIYIGFGSHCDQPPYSGWLFAYDAATFKQEGMYQVKTPRTISGAGIWMSGAGLAADSSGNLFVATGNAADVDKTIDDGYGDSILKLDKDLNLTAVFTPSTQRALGAADNDLGSGGVLLLPDQAGRVPRLAVQSGKDGTINLIDRDAAISLVGPPPLMAVQTIPNAVGRPDAKNVWTDCIFGMPAFWNNAVYFWGHGDVLRAFSLTNGILSKTPATSSYTSSSGANMSITTSVVGGHTYGIVWALQANDLTQPPVLQAYDAEAHQENLNRLYSSDWFSGDKPTGNAIKFTVPTAIRGKVYVGANGGLTVYGLSPTTICQTCWRPIL